MQYNDLMQKVGKRINPKLYYFVDNEKVELGYDDIIQAKPFFNATLVGTVMKGIELETTKIIPNVPIYFENKVSYDEDSATKIIGPYYLKEEPTFNADSKTYSSKFYDNFITSMIDYVPINISYPTTIINFFQKLCEKCGYTTDIMSLPNGERLIKYDIYDGIGYTYRDVFEDIGQATGTLFKMNNKNVEKCGLSSESITIDDDILKNQNISLGQHFGPINSIILSRAGDTDFIYKRDETLTSWNEFTISENQLMNDNDRSDYLEELYNALYGIEYDVFDLELVGYGGFEPLQKITIETNGETYNSYVFNNEEKYTQDYEEVIYTELPNESKKDYSVSDETDKRINQTYIIVNKQNQTIESLVNKTSEYEDRITSVEQTANEIVQKVESKIDFTRNAASKYKVVIEDAQEGPLIGLHIMGEIELLYPDNDLYPSNDLYPLDSYLIIENGEGIKQKIWLPIDYLYKVENTSDEFVIERIYDEEQKIYEQHMKIIRHIYVDNNGNKFISSNEKIEDLGLIEINLSKGKNTIWLESFYDVPLDFYVEYGIENDFSKEFATKGELKNSISQTENSINLELEKKVDDKTLTGANIMLRINADESEASIEADKINMKGKEFNLTVDNMTIKADNFKVDEEGNLKCSNANISGIINSSSGTIGGWTINSSGLTNGTIFIRNDGYSTIYTAADIFILKAILRGEQWANVESGTPEFNRYDLNGDGVINSADLLYMRNMLNMN